MSVRVDQSAHEVTTGECGIGDNEGGTSHLVKKHGRILSIRGVDITFETLVDVGNDEGICHDRGTAVIHLGQSASAGELESELDTIEVLVSSVDLEEGGGHHVDTVAISHGTAIFHCQDALDRALSVSLHDREVVREGGCRGTDLVINVTDETCEVDLVLLTDVSNLDVEVDLVAGFITWLSFKVSMDPHFVVLLKGILCTFTIVT